MRKNACLEVYSFYLRTGVMKETIVIISEEVYGKLPAKEKKEFYHFERYNRMYERETGGDGDWVGDDAFDNLDDLCKFAGEKNADDIDSLDVYTCCYKVFDDEEDKEYFEDFANGLKGTQLKIKKANPGWYKNNIYDPDYTG